MNTNNSAAMLPPNVIPGTTQAVAMYRNSGGVLTDPHPFGTDLLNHHAGLAATRDLYFDDKNFKAIFSSLHIDQNALCS